MRIGTLAALYLQAHSDPRKRREEYRWFDIFPNWQQPDRTSRDRIKSFKDRLREHDEKIARYERKRSPRSV